MVMRRSKNHRMAHSAGPPLDHAVLERAAAKLAELARRQHVRIALIGGFALQKFGSPRFTSDLDTVVSGPLRGLRPGKPLSFGGIRTVLTGKIPVDLILRDDSYALLYEKGLDHAIRIPGCVLPIVPLEYIAAMKLAAHRSKDLMDLEFLIAENKIDLRKTRKIIHEYLGGRYPVDDFDSIVMEIRWKKASGKL
jgi:hypothetical protein